MRVFHVLVLGAIAVAGLFSSFLGPTSYAPLPCCSASGGFQTTFAMLESDSVFIAEDASPDDKERIGRLEMELEDLRGRLQIPGFSAAIVKDQQVLWARGFGCADIASGTPATPHTPYHLASLTKPFGATVLLQLVEEGLVDLDDPVVEYGISLDSKGVIRVKHLLSHTSLGVPGDRYKYHGDRFGLIDRVMSSVVGASFRALVTERILVPLGMEDTLPAPVGSEVDAYAKGEGDPRFQGAWDRLATPYWLVRGYGNVVGEYASYFGSAAGLISSVMDYAKLDVALDEHRLVTEQTQEMSWTPFVSNRGRELPYGYGWFIQARRGLRYIWHYGYWDCTSTLIVKVPERGLTFLLFANSDRLSSPFGLGADANVRRSPAARAFLDIFVE
jgi:CubicO group peptidase (beta-lactamase class C family)